MARRPGIHAVPRPSGEIDTIRALAHDLKGPLAAIQYFASSSSGDVERRMRGISEQACWLAALVDDVLEGGSDDLLTAVNASDLVDRLALRTPTANGCHIAVQGDRDVWVSARLIALSRALGCVLENAIRAAGPGGNVVLGVRGGGHGVDVTVADDGPGLGNMPPQTRLGLTITRAMVAACGGVLTLGSTRAAGTIATIRLARVPAVGVA